MRHQEIKWQLPFTIMLIGRFGEGVCKNRYLGDKISGWDPTPNNIPHCDRGQLAELHCTLVLFLHLQTEANNSYLRCRGGTEINELMSRTCCGEKVGSRDVIISTNLWLAQDLLIEAFLCFMLTPLFVVMNSYIPFLLLWDMNALVQEVMSSSRPPEPGCSMRNKNKKPGSRDDEN